MLYATNVKTDSPDRILNGALLFTWRDRAACWGQDPELFFPDGKTAPALVQTEKAKAVCSRCEVAEACLKWALESGQDTGVWGGLSEGERRALKRGTAAFGRAS
jgi:WhiB family redox-sensing transcriptional regulator